MIPALFMSYALAHVPHDVVRAFSATAGPWWLLADPEGTRLLLRSDDRGRTFTFVGGPPIADVPDALTTLDDGTLVLLGEQKYWWSSDEGASWSSAPAPDGANQVAGGPSLVLAGRGGIWEGAPGALRRVFNSPPVLLLGRDRIAVIESGGLTVDTATGWRPLHGPGVTDARSVATDGTTIYLGTASGAVWRHRGGRWAPCGALPPDTASGTTYPDVMGLAVDGALLLAATAWRAPFVSEDGCDTWIDRHTPREVTFDGDGGATGPEEAWPFVTAVDGRWVMGGWLGYWWSDDQGVSWSDALVLPPDYTRGIAFASDFKAFGKVYLGAYAAGPAWTDGGGAYFAAPAHGIPAPNVQRIAAQGSREVPGVYGIVAHDGYASHDGGQSWVPFGFDADSVEAITTFSGSQEVWALGQKGGRQVIDATVNGGSTWAPLDALTQALGGAQAVSAAGFLMADAREVRCVSAREPNGLACSTDAGGKPGAQTWRGVVLSPEADQITGPVGWPSGAATRVLWTSSEGVHLSDDILSTAVLDDGALPTVHTMRPTDQDGPVALTEAADGSLFLATEAGSVWRSQDGGITWTDLHLRLPAWVHVLAARPDFQEHPDLLVGTSDGTFRVAEANGAAPTLTRWARFERIDNRSDFLECDACPAARGDDGAGMDSLSAIPAGVTATAWLRGTDVRVYGRSVLGGAAELWIDGSKAAEMVHVRDGWLAHVTGLPDTWHFVELRGTVGQGVLLDAVEAYGPSDLLVLDALDDTGDRDEGDTASVKDAEEGQCGCAETRPAGWVGVIAGAALVAAVRRRRQ